MVVIPEALAVQQSNVALDTMVLGRHTPVEWSTIYPAASMFRAVIGQSVCLRSDNQPIAPRHAIQIASLSRPDLSLKSPMQIFVEQAGSEFVAYSLDIEEFAVGSDEQSAISELKASIAESYYILRDEQKSLGPLQIAHWKFLKNLILEI